MAEAFNLKGAARQAQEGNRQELLNLDRQACGLNMIDISPDLEKKRGEVIFACA